MQVKSQVSQKLAALGTTATVETQWEVDVFTGSKSQSLATLASSDARDESLLGSLRGAGTDAVVSIVLHGANGVKSEPIRLDNDVYK